MKRVVITLEIDVSDKVYENLYSALDGKYFVPISHLFPESLRNADCFIERVVHNQKDKITSIVAMGNTLVEKDFKLKLFGKNIVVFANSLNDAMRCQPDVERYCNENSIAIDSIYYAEKPSDFQKLPKEVHLTFAHPDIRPVTYAELIRTYQDVYNDDKKPIVVTI